MDYVNTFLFKKIPMLKFGEEIRLEKEGVFLLSLPLITIAYSLIKPEKPLELVIASIILFLFVPFFVTRFLLKESVHFLGFKKGKLLKGAMGLIFSLLITFPVLNLLASQPDFQRLYPPFKAMRESASGLIALEFLVMLPAFFAVQTFLFGYALSGISRLTGKSKSIFVLSFLCIPLFYLGRPMVEIVLAAFTGVLASWIRFRGDSVLYSIVFGWSLSFILDALVIYKALLENL